MTNDEIKTDIIEACKKFREEGYRLVSGAYTGEDDEPCGGCALAAVAFVHGDIEPVKGEGEEIVEFVAARYGWNGAQCEDFTDGFDDIGWRSGPVAVLGRAVRDEVLPVRAGTL